MTTSDFSMSVAPTTATVTAPATVNITVTVTQLGNTPSGVSFDTPNLPSNVSAMVTPEELSGTTNTAQLSITVSSAGSGSVELDGTGLEQHGEAAGYVTRMATVQITAN